VGYSGVFALLFLLYQKENPQRDYKGNKKIKI